MRPTRTQLATSLLAASMSVNTAAFAQDSANDGYAAEAKAIVVTAARSVLPANALPLTVDVISKVDLDQQVAISGSVTDAVATLTPSFSPRSEF